LTSYLEQEEVDILGVTIPDSAGSIEDFAEEANTPAEVLLEFLPFWELWQKIEYVELPEEMTYEMRMRNSLSGMASGLDDTYTSYLDPDQYRQLEIDLQGEYEGIGAWVDPSADYLTIISPMEGSPAEKAGLLPGDRVIAVDGEDMTGVDGNLVIGKVLGPAGTKVVLTIERDGVDEPFDVEIIRAHIILPNVESEILEGNIAYVQLFTFGDDSHEDIRDALIEVLDQNPVGLILDLRGNGGGWLDVAIDITSEFIQEGVLLYQESGDGSREIHEARTSNGLATEIPLVVLVDGGSASASEILAGAIQDHDRGVIVGITTFGKGSVQRAYPLSNGQGVLRITTDKWLTPAERHIQGLGLEPDYVVEITEEDIEADYDPQLEKAIELLLNN
jgi:carboxyl-terminal processing protease